MADIVVEVSHLSVKFGDFTAVNDVSFSVKRGEIFGFLGANGAGKTTTIRVLCGLLVPTEGRVHVAGLEFTDDTAQTIKNKVGYMSQKFTLYTDLTVAENLSFAASLRKMSKARFEERRAALFKFIGFAQPPTALVRDLPGGLKQELSLVAAMLHDPDIIFLDEPTAGVSPVSRSRFWKLINRLSSEGKTIFVTTHYMDEAEECHRIALMRAGQLIALDSPENLKTTAYPEPMWEITPPAHADPAWLQNLREVAHGELQPYGMRYHVSQVAPPDWNKFMDRWGGTLKVRSIRPSLEDVFIRLVEGKER